MAGTMTGSARLSGSRPDLWWPEGWGPPPRFATPRDKSLRTWGPNAGQMADRLGRPFFQFQQFIADVALEVRSDGQWRFDNVFLFLPRRSGKTFMEQAVVATLGFARPSYIVMTAQTRDKAKDRWKDVCSNPITRGYTSVPWMAKKVKVTVGTGNERCLWLDNGSTFVPFAPNEDSGHGDQIDQVWVDELWSFDLAERDAIQTGYEPSGLIGNLQVWHLSAAGTSRSMWLKEARAQGRASVDDPGSRTAYFEWSLRDDQRMLEGDALVDAIMGMHPRSGLGLRREFLAQQVRDKSRSRVLRDYGNIDADGDTEMCIPSAAWEKTAAADRIPFGATVCVGVAQDDGRRESTVAAGWLRPDGTVQTDTVQHAAGVRWVEDYVAQMPNVECVAVVASKFGRGVADAVAGVDGGPDVLRMTSGDAVSAAQTWVAAAVEDGGRGLSHDGSAALRDALVAGEVPAGKGWQSRSGEPVTAAVAHSLARWAVLHRPEKAARMPPFRMF